MSDTLDHISEQVSGNRSASGPPLHLWHPPLSGDIDIRINRAGRWYHEGRPIERESLVRLFASILRRERDGDYYLVTPVEKWRIRVDLYPLMVVDVNPAGEGVLRAILNTGREVVVDAENPLFLARDADDVAAMRLPNGLSALFTRAAWYRLVDSASERDGVAGVESSGQWFPLATT